MQKGLLKTAMENMRKMDKTLFLMIILYSILGLVIILSASSVSAVLRYKVFFYETTCLCRFWFIDGFSNH